MSIEIIIPRLGWNMEEGIFHGWLKSDGAEVRIGEPLFQLEGDKSVQDVESTDAGVLRIAANAPKVGDTVTVGMMIGHLMTADIPVASKVVTPRARRVAEERGIDPTNIQGTGKNGRVRERDILAVAPIVQKTAPAPTPNIRKTIANRMVQSHQTTAPVTLTTTVDATNLVNLREQFRTTGGTIPSYTDFIVKLTAIALQAHSALNSRWEDDSIVTPNEFNIGIAVDTEAGLLVPVVRNVDRVSLRELATQSKSLIEKARERKLSAEEMSGGTFTVTNLGAFGIEAFTPIINLPECAILGIGAIQTLPAVVNGAIVVREKLTLSLTFDHRIVDGAPAAKFLAQVRSYLENPSPWLMG